MSTVSHEVRVAGREGFRRGLPPLVGGLLLEHFAKTVDGAVRMAFERRSRAPGRRRSWLNDAADVRLADVQPGDEAVLHFEARPFGEIADELYRQQEIWPSSPDPTWSAIDVAAAMIDDVGSGQADSERFDLRLLRLLQGFGRVLNGQVNLIRVEAKHRPSAQPEGFVSLDSPVIVRAHTLTAATPPAREVRVVGVLDMLRQSTQGFALRLDDGQEVRGCLVDGDVSDVRALLGNRVVVQGKSVFRPSGRLLRLDARVVVPGAGEGSFWSKMPRASQPSPSASKYRRPQAPTSGVNALFRTWPGEESDEELLELLSSAS